MRNTKRIAVCLVFALLLSAFPALSFAETGQTPRIAETVYPTDDIVIADIVATEAPYLADSTGQTDCTQALQNAIDDCERNGGGTVFLPAGRYLVTGSVYIKPFVTLHGDWQDPDEGTDYGTVIVARPESTEEKCPALFEVGASAGAVGLTVWYPEQTLDQVKPYPYTFYVNGKRDYMLHTLKNITLLNSYRGVGLCSVCEDGIYQCHEMTTLENIKGTCLYEGLNSHNSADVDVYKTISFENRYWLGAGQAYNAPDADALAQYTRANASGMVLGDLEWPEIADVTISDCLYGIHIVKGIRVMFNGSFWRVSVKNCDYAYYAEEDAVWARGANWGVSFADSELQGSRYAACYRGKGILELHNVTTRGTVRVKSLQVTRGSETSVETHKNHQKPAAYLYTVSADRTGAADASAAVQAALDRAASTGGVVYLPGGIYRFEAPVSVPAGVELRGSSSVSTRDQGGCTNGTLIFSYYGYGENDSPLVTLAGDGAGVSGLRFDYPENTPDTENGTFRGTTPCIYSAADNVYIANSFICLASVGVRLEGADNAFIKRLVGTSYVSMISMQDCASPWIEATLQNGNAVTRNGYRQLGLPEAQYRFDEKDIFTLLFDPVLKQTCTYLAFDSCEDVTVFNTFIYGTKHYLSEKDTSILLVNIGCDGNNPAEPSLMLDGGNVVLLNSMRCDGKMYNIENKAKYRSSNSMLISGRCREYTVIKNLSSSELPSADLPGLILQPFYRIISFIEKLFNR
ncbi:MAG: hypothetical protein IK118_08960 [Clostridia bacterium]|nr:hypothetical protein [Clostridia bacterium]